MSTDDYTVKLERDYEALEARHGALIAALKQLMEEQTRGDMRDAAESAIELDARAAKGVA